MKSILKSSLSALVLSIAFASGLYAQNCTNFIAYQSPAFPYKFNSQSKSATCESGKTYKFVVTMQDGRDYKIAFYASAVFNNEINFKVLDQGTNKTVLDIPGKRTNENGKCALEPQVFADHEGEYPSFDFHPQSALTVQIEITVQKNEKEDVKRGCVGVLIQEKKSDQVGF